MNSLNIQQGPEQYHISQITNAIIQQRETLTHITLDIWSNHLSILDPFAHIVCCRQLQVLTITIANEDQIINIIAHAITACEQLHTVNIKFLHVIHCCKIFTNLENAIAMHKNIKNLTLEFYPLDYYECDFLHHIIKRNNTIIKYKFTGMRSHEYHLDWIINALKDKKHVVEFIVDSIYTDQVNRILTHCQSVETFETEYILPSARISISLSEFNLNTTICNLPILESMDQKYADILTRNRKIKVTKILIDIVTSLYKLNLTVYTMLEIVRHLLDRYRITDFFIVRTITKINQSIDKSLLRHA